MAETEQQLDVRKIPPYKKHAAIFETYNNLGKGEAFVIINDHDPKPLRFQFIAERGKDKFSWEYLEEGPQVWRVRIGKTG
ncbi:MAG TPA: DUF2249 domain-containing protein [Balneolaceae bacterium]|nr:DUF2249 domain-containing protein [Balneolaceae bacterium]